MDNKLPTQIICERALKTLANIQKDLETVIEFSEIYSQDPMPAAMNVIRENYWKAESRAEYFCHMIRNLPLPEGLDRPNSVIEVFVKNRPEYLPKVNMGFTEEGWFVLELPWRLMKKEKGNVKYLRGFLYPLLEEFFRYKPCRSYEKVVMIYRYVYGPNGSKLNATDMDNIEANATTDALATFLFPDDNYHYCWFYYYAVPGEFTHTEAIVIPREDFLLFLKREKEVPPGTWKLLPGKKDWPKGWENHEQEVKERQRLRAQKAEEESRRIAKIREEKGPIPYTVFQRPSNDDSNEKT